MYYLFNQLFLSKKNKIINQLDKSLQIYGHLIFNFNR